MNKRISRNGITTIARSYNQLYHSMDQFNASKNGTVQLFNAMVTALADMLADDNKNFDIDRFYTVVFNPTPIGER